VKKMSRDERWKEGHGPLRSSPRRWPIKKIRKPKQKKVLVFSGVDSMWSISAYGKSFEHAISLLQWSALPPREALESQDVRIRVKAAALNFFDLLAMCKRYQVVYPLPMSPGTEVSGEVVEVGSECSTVKPGDQVIVAFAGNALRTEIIVPLKQVLKKPPSLSHQEASAMFVGYATAYHGLIQRGHLRNGETVLVTGAAGGMGLFAIAVCVFFFFFFCFFFMGFQLAREHGAGRIVCTVSDEKKRAACIKAGATDVVVLAADSKRWTEQLKSALPDGCDVCYEICGGDLFECCMRVMSSYGRLLVIGFTSGTIPSAKANLPLVKGFSIVGVRSGAELLLKPELMRQMEDAMQASRIHPEIEVFPVHAAKEAFTKLANREAVGKLVLDFSSVSSKL
jgi:NADPH2:quinone reductase